MANALLTPTAVTREALRILHEKLNFVGNINRQYDDSFAKEGAKIGDSLKIRLPNQYEVRDGATLSTQDTTETSTTLQVATQKGVDLNFTSKDLTTDLDDFSKRILDPAMSVLAANIEADAFSMYKDVWNSVGTVGTTPAGLTPFLDGRTKLNKALAPKDSQRCAIINSEASAATVDALKGLFHDSKEVAKQYREGAMGKTAGLMFFENESTPVHTNGTMGGTALVNGASQTGATIAIDGLSASGTVTAGTTFTLAGVYAVHPETKESYAHLQQFTVTADATASTGAIAALAISPSIITSGATQTVSGSPADNAAITWQGAASAVIPQNLVFHKDAFTFATADLVMPSGVDFAAREVFDGISMRIVRAYDINNDKFPCRLDVLYGYKAIRPEIASRVVG